MASLALFKRKVIALSCQARPNGHYEFVMVEKHDPTITYTFPRGKGNPKKILLGAGGCCKVYEGTMQDGTSIAVRKKIKIKAQSADTRRRHIATLTHQTREEIKLTRAIQNDDHPGKNHVLPILAYTLDPTPGHENLFVVMPKAGPDLHTICSERFVAKTPFTSKELYSIFRQVLLGLQALNKQGAFQLDLKPENVIEKDGVFYLIDLLHVARVNNYEMGFAFSPTHSSPEVARYKVKARTGAEARDPLLTEDVLPKAQSWAAGGLLYFLMNFKSFGDAMHTYLRPNAAPIENNQQMYEFVTLMSTDHHYANFHDDQFKDQSPKNNFRTLVKHLTDPDLDKRWSIDHAVSFLEEMGKAIPDKQYSLPVELNSSSNDNGVLNNRGIPFLSPSKIIAFFIATSLVYQGYTNRNRLSGLSSGFVEMLKLFLGNKK